VAKRTVSSGLGSLGSGAVTAVALAVQTGLAAVVGIIIARDFGRTAETDGFFASYGVFIVVVLAATAIRLAVLPPLARARDEERLGSEVAAYAATLAMLAAPLFCLALFGSHPLALLLTGNALHSDVSPDAPPSGFLGWMLTCLGQQYGFPVPEGGASQLTAALVRRLEARGGTVQCSAPVTRVVVHDRRAVAVTLADGSKFTTSDAVTGKVFVVIRPSSVGVHRARPEGSARNVWQASVNTIEQHGDLVRLALTGPPDTIADITPSAVADLELTVGAQVWLSAKATDIAVHADE